MVDLTRRQSIAAAAGIFGAAIIPTVLLPDQAKAVTVHVDSEPAVLVDLAADIEELRDAWLTVHALTDRCEALRDQCWPPEDDQDSVVIEWRQTAEQMEAACRHLADVRRLLTGRLIDAHGLTALFYDGVTAGTIR